MKNLRKILVLLLFPLFCQPALSQQTCKVLLQEISGTYEGRCKNGLADGKGSASGTDRYIGHFLKGLPDGVGSYFWATGEIYTGHWKEGKRHGEGKYSFYYHGKDSTITGIWENDDYKGQKVEKPKIIYKSSIDRYRFEKTGNIKNRVLINIYQNGARNTGVSNLMISSSSGYETSLGNSFGYDEVTFPVTVRVSYTTMNKLKTASYYVEFHFEIFDPGDWKVDLHN